MRDYMQVSEVKRGMKVVSDDGPRKITSVTKGMIPGHVSLNWSGGFGEVGLRDQVEVEIQTPKMEHRR